MTSRDSRGSQTKLPGKTVIPRQWVVQVLQSLTETETGKPQFLDVSDVDLRTRLLPVPGVEAVVHLLCKGTNADC